MSKKQNIATCRKCYFSASSLTMKRFYLNKVSSGGMNCLVKEPFFLFLQRLKFEPPVKSKNYMAETKSTMGFILKENENAELRKICPSGILRLIHEDPEIKKYLVDMVYVVMVGED